MPKSRCSNATAFLLEKVSELRGESYEERVPRCEL